MANAEKSTTETENRFRVAEAIARRVAEFAAKHKQDAGEIVALADTRDWHLFARLAGQPVEYHPSLATQTLVRELLHHDAKKAA